MLLRPWPIILLAFFHLISPAINVLVGASLVNTSLKEFLFWQWEHLSIYTFFSMYLSSPLAGFFIYQCKKWSYYAFFISILYILVFNYIHWIESPYLYDPLHVMGFFCLNSLLLGYFLAPSVRKVYFSDRIRWWETEARYLFHLDGRLLKKNEEIPIQIHNLSFGGALIEAKDSSFFKVGETYSLLFSYSEYSINLSCEVKNHRGLYFGLQFQHTSETQKELHFFLKEVVIPYYQNRDESPPWLESFLLWLNHLMRTGEGIFPQQAFVSSQARKKLKKKKRKKTTKKSLSS